MNRTHSFGAAVVAAALALGCAVGAGEGSVTSERLVVEDCWTGPFDLHPDFFAANPDNGKSLMIRVQRGDNLEEQSDGLLVLVNDLPALREQLEQPIDIGLPPGVSPPGVPIVFNPNPPKVSMALYLHNTCHAQTGTLYALSGQITFHALFSGDRNEENAEDRLTDAAFSGVFADPRQLTADDQANAAIESTVTGNFRFYFQRGQPAQPF
ncbi:MAG TPA: hypothetical protein VG937_26875 [Polyangiaceae bacterium]|nr:hypothetical protein [Polyangiaceae bacterium]